jgi:hypothetical protein
MEVQLWVVLIWRGEKIAFRPYLVRLFASRMGLTTLFWMERKMKRYWKMKELSTFVLIVVSAIFSTPSAWGQTPIYFSIFARQDIDIRPGATFESYPDSNMPIVIGTGSIAASAITISGGVAIQGDVICGLNGDPNTVIDTKASTVITGKKYAAEVEFEFPPVTLPSYLVTLPKAAYSPTSALVGAKHYGDITINGIQTVEGDCHILIDGTLTIKNGGGIYVADGASLTLYLNGNLFMGNDAYMGNANYEVCSLRIYGTELCTAIQLGTKTNLTALIYALSSNIIVGNGSSVCGCMVGQSIQIKNSGSFYFDTRIF